MRKKKWFLGQRKRVAQQGRYMRNIELRQQNVEVAPIGLCDFERFFDPRNITRARFFRSGFLRRMSNDLNGYPFRGVYGADLIRGDLDKRTSFYTEKKAISRIQNDERRPITELQTLRKCGARKSLPASIGGWLLFCTLSRFQSRHRGKLTYWGTQLWNLSGIVRWLIPAVKCCEARAQNKIGVIPGKFHFGRTCEGVRSKLTECRAQFRTQNMAKNRRPTMRGVHTSNPRELKIETFR